MSLTEQDQFDDRRRKYNAKMVDRQKVYARNSVFTALKSGRLIRALACEDCGETGPVEAHHDDYTKRLEVRWLCGRCHEAVHVKTHCKYGHELTPENIYVRPNTNFRRCRTCRYTKKGSRQ